MPDSSGRMTGGLPVVLCDLDGVVWLGEEPLPGAAEGVAHLRRLGCRVAFLTNNSSLTVAAGLARLARAGIDAAPGDWMSSARAAAGLVRSGLAAGGRVLACSGPGVVEALEAEGLEAVDSVPCEAVVVGWHRHFDFDRLDRAAEAVRSGARFVATNLDPTYPAPGRRLPGNGALVAAVATAGGRSPEVAGKPEAPTVELVRRHFPDAPRGVVVGDRISTDGRLAVALGWPFALVESEVTAEETDGAGGSGGIVSLRAASLAEAAGMLAGQWPAAGGATAGRPGPDGVAPDRASPPPR